MIFCFVRETKQLTLEELDRKCNVGCLIWSPTDVSRRGVFGPNESFHQTRVDCVASILHQATHPPEKDHEATTDHRKGRQGRRTVYVNRQSKTAAK